MLESESCANPSSLCRDSDIFTSALFNTRVKAALASAADGIGERFHPFLNPTKSQSIRLYSSLVCETESRALSIFMDLLQKKFISHQLLSLGSKKPSSSQVKRELLQTEATRAFF